MRYLEIFLPYNKIEGNLKKRDLVGWRCIAYTMSELSEKINQFLHNLKEEEINLLYSCISSLLGARRRRNLVSVISGITSSYQSFLSNIDLSEAVNESLKKYPLEKSQELFERLLNLYQNGSNPKSIVSGILREIAGLIDESKWSMETETNAQVSNNNTEIEISKKQNSKNVQKENTHHLPKQVRQELLRQELLRKKENQNKEKKEANHS